MTSPPNAPVGPRQFAHRWALRGLPAMAMLAGLTMGALSGCGRQAPVAVAVTAAPAASAPATSPSRRANPPSTSQPASTAAALVTSSAATAPSVKATNTPASASARGDATAPTSTAESPPAFTQAAGTQAAAALPAAIVAFQKQRDACDHFRSEEPYDPQRAAFLKARLAKTCKGSDRTLAALRQRFAQHPAALAALQGYEDRIE